MREVVASGFNSLGMVNLTSNAKNVAEGRKCTKTRNWKHYWIKIRAKRKKNNTMDDTSNKRLGSVISKECPIFDKNGLFVHLVSFMILYVTTFQF